MHTVPPDFKEHEVQTTTQADRLEHEAEQAEARAKAEIEHREKEFHKKEKAAKEKAKKTVDHVERNSDNPVVIGNAIAVVALSAGLGFGAYRKYAAGELTWKVVAAWTGVVGLFAAGDYYLSQCVYILCS